jgi:peptide/nickel transport system ATP-binding protein
MTQPHLLKVEDLHVRLPVRTGEIHAVRGVSFELGRERLGIVGESGAGKSLTGRAILGVAPPSSVVDWGRMVFDGVDVPRASSRAMRRVRGRRITMVMQDPRASLNPVMPVGHQIVESYRAHIPSGWKDAREKTLAMLESMKIHDPKRTFSLYPHEVSGGMAQRIMLAMMLITGPDLLIADEPTSSLDATVAREVLRLLDQLIYERKMALILISHDLRLVSSFCDRVLIMRAGRVIDQANAADLAHATHSYTRGLWLCLPTLDDTRRPLPVLQRDLVWDD